MTAKREAAELHLPWWVQPLNRVVLALNGVGVPVPGAHVLRMKGRRTGKVRNVVITPFSHAGQRYVIVGIPGSAWTANVRPTGTAQLLHGKNVTAVRLTEVTDDDEKRRVMRAYPSIQPLGVYPFRIMGHVRSSDPDEWARAASKVELFRIDPAGSAGM
ncbi:MAG TPA: nitroreductase/quinone reductase family protein [Thermomicrobiales bacterium]|nr:nitroreductase/quinone reductase family protein [Thermomicrobiales bacterium]